MNAGRNTAWEQLAAAGLVRGEPPPVPLQSPWYVRLVLGLAGWIAAAFLLGFVVAAMAWIIESRTASVATSLLLMGVAWYLFFRMGRNDFATQFALALSFAGQVLFAAGVFGWSGEGSNLRVSWLLMTLLQALLLIVMPNPVHRLWSGFAAAASAYAALLMFDVGYLCPPLLLAGAAGLWLNEFRSPRAGPVLRPAAYGMVAALILMEMAHGIYTPGLGMSPEFGSPPGTGTRAGQLLSGAVLLVTAWILLRRADCRWPEKAFVAALAGALALILVSLQAPGIVAGTCILLLGFAHGNAVLTGLGVLGLLLYASGYYYELDTTLLVKSQVMAATGGLLLLLRWLLRRLFASGETGA